MLVQAKTVCEFNGLLSFKSKTSPKLDKNQIKTNKMLSFFRKKNSESDGSTKFGSIRSVVVDVDVSLDHDDS